MLAHHLLKICANLIDHLKNILFSHEFLVRHRKNPRDFSRTRLLPFPSVILILLNMLKSALQVELNYFFKAIHGTDTADPVVTASAFCQARMKLKHQAFVELNQEQVSFFYNHFPPRLWHGLRLLAFDGSTLQLPSIDDLIDHFGGCPDENHSPLARVSQLYDVLNHITLDAALSPFSVGERELATQHMNWLQTGDLALLDRGYSAFWLFALICSRSTHFCARMNIDQWAVVRQFYQSGSNEAIVTLHPSSHSAQKCREKGISSEPLTVRLIRVELENGVIEILMTSLLDMDQFPYEFFEPLYHERWGIEGNFNTMKHRLQMENLTGKSSESVYQDFYARIFSLNFTAILIHPAQDSVTQDSSSRTYSYQVNFTKALSYMKDSVVLLFLRSSISILLDSLQILFCKNTEPIRPHRKYPRKRRIRNRNTYSYAYKQSR
ncbi:MAG: IS4 family transposase [Cyclobacteriaceae bacterium]|nr:IS4 family transposase [Cyclobacteriaceae bacterium]